MISGRPPLDLPSRRMLVAGGLLVLAVVVLLLASCGPGPVTPEDRIDGTTLSVNSRFSDWSTPRRLPSGAWFTWGLIRHPEDSSVTVALTVRLLPSGEVEGSVDDYPIPASWHPGATALLRGAARGGLR